MIIEGGEIVIGTMVHSNNDHRIAMATAVAALGANGPVIIQQAEAVEKSYPEFFNDLAHLNVSLQKNINDTFAAAGS